MVTLDTFRTLHEHDHKLACYCATCERWAVLDLERLIADGRGDYFVGRKPRCSYCRSPGARRSRPPSARSNGLRDSPIRTRSPTCGYVRGRTDFLRKAT